MGKCQRLLQEKHQKVTKRRKPRDRTIKNMDKYAQLKTFHHDRQLQVYMYDFMYVDTKTIPVEDYFPATKIFCNNYIKVSTPGPVPKHWL